MQAPNPIKTMGIYPGSGVAPGGQQGRMQFAHNGLPGANPGGQNPGASQLRPMAPGARPMNPSQGFMPADFQALLKALMATRMGGDQLRLTRGV